MSASTTTTLSNTLQKHFSKVLLKEAVQATRKYEFGMKGTLDKRRGAKTISFFRPEVADDTEVQTLSEGVAINTFRGVTYTEVNVTLTQYGLAAKITDVLDNTGFFNAFTQSMDTMANDFALKTDTLIRNALNAQTTGLNIRRAGNVSTWTALNSATIAASVLEVAEVLDAVTELRVNRAPTFDNKYIAICPPQVLHSLMKDTEWQDTAKYGAPDRLFSGEVGMIRGVRFIEDTNPFIALGSATAGDEYTYSTAGTGTTTGAKVYSTFFVGKGAYGVPALAGDSPIAPKALMVTGPDKNDPLNQFSTIGYKAYFGVKVLDASYGIAFKSKSEYV